MIHETVAVVAAIFSGGVQPHHHLVPPTVLAQMLWEACEVTFGQPFQLAHHLLSPVHGVKTMDPKHDLDLHLQGQHAAKRFVPGIDQPSAVHLDSAKLRQLTCHRGVPLVYPPVSTNHTLALDPLVQG